MNLIDNNKSEFQGNLFVVMRRLRVYRTVVLGLKIAASLVFVVTKRRKKVGVGEAVDFSILNHVKQLLKEIGRKSYYQSLYLEFQEIDF
jgi:hypothetical protein